LRNSFIVGLMLLAGIEAGAQMNYINRLYKFQSRPVKFHSVMPRKDGYRLRAYLVDSATGRIGTRLIQIDNAGDIVAHGPFVYDSTASLATWPVRRSVNRLSANRIVFTTSPLTSQLHVNLVSADSNLQVQDIRQIDTTCNAQ